VTAPAIALPEVREEREPVRQARDERESAPAPQERPQPHPDYTPRLIGGAPPSQQAERVEREEPKTAAEPRKDEETETRE